VSQLRLVVLKGLVAPLELSRNPEEKMRDPHMNELEVTQVGKQIRLMDPQLHVSGAPQTAPPV
jgi:hypothetical protein